MRIGRSLTGIALATIFVLATTNVHAAAKIETSEGEAVKSKHPQSTCPVMGGKVSQKSPYVDVKGYRVYICCPGCAEKIKKDPDKYIKKIRKNGETLYQIPKSKNERSNRSEGDENDAPKSSD